MTHITPWFFLSNTYVFLIQTLCLLFIFIFYFIYKYNSKKFKKNKIESKIDFRLLFSTLIGISQIGICFLNYFIFKASFYSIFAYTNLLFVFMLFDWKSLITYALYWSGYFLLGIYDLSIITSIKILNIILEPIILLGVAYLIKRFVKKDKWIPFVVILGFIINYFLYFIPYDIHQYALTIFLNIIFSYVMYVSAYLGFIFLQSFIRNIIKINQLTIYQYENIYNFKAAKPIYDAWISQNKILLHVTLVLSRKYSFEQTPDSNAKIGSFLKHNKFDSSFIAYWNNLNCLSILIDISEDKHLTANLNDFFNKSPIIQELKNNINLNFDYKEYCLLFNIVFPKTIRFDELDPIVAQAYFLKNDNNYVWIPIIDFDSNLYWKTLGSNFKKIKYLIRDYSCNWVYNNFLKNHYELLITHNNKAIKSINDMNLPLEAKSYLLKYALINKPTLLNKDLKDAYLILEIPFDLISTSKIDLDFVFYSINKIINNNKLIIKTQLEKNNPILLENLISLSTKYKILISNFDQDILNECLCLNPKYIIFNHGYHILEFAIFKNKMINKLKKKIVVT